MNRRLSRATRVLGLIALALVFAPSCQKRAPLDSNERARIAEWQSMAQSARSPEALTELRTRARAGVVEARSALGRALITQSDAALAQEGLEMLRAAAAADDVPALLTLGKAELQGGPLPKDLTAARRHLTRAADLGEARAHYHLGVMDHSGYAGPEDHAAAARHFDVATKSGIPQAMFWLANAYREGDGVDKDEKRALSLYEQAAEADHPESIQTLAIAYQRGELGLPADARRFQEELAELAHALKHAPLPP